MDVIFFQGMLLGLLVSIPPGPVGALCFNRALTKGRLAGLSAALGIAFADLVFAVFVVSGLQAVSEFVLAYEPYMRIVAAGTFLAIGVRLIFMNKVVSVLDKSCRNAPIRSAAASFFSIFLLAMTNPLLILTFAVLFSFFGLSFQPGGLVHPFMLVSGVFFGALAWWCFVVYAADWLKANVKRFSMTVVNKIIGITVMVFAIIILANSLFELLF